MKKFLLVALLLVTFFAANAGSAHETKKESPNVLSAKTTTPTAVAETFGFAVESIWCSEFLSENLFKADQDLGQADNKCYCKYLYPDGSHCWNRITCGYNYCMTHSGFIPGTDSPR